jgi:hypothetical protein
MPQNERPPPASRAGDGPPIEQSGRTLDSRFSEDGGDPQCAPPSAVGLADAPPISPIALAEGCETLFGVTMDMCDWSASHLRSAADAAWRGDKETLGAHLRQAHSALEAAIMTYNALEAELAPA